MAIYEIVTAQEPVLREKAKEVPKITANVIKLLENMADTMYHAEGVGLAAPQIGISKRVIVVDVGEGLIEIINPEIQITEGEQTEVEGCLSIPGVQGEVTRSAKVVVSGLNREGEKVIIEGIDLLARALLHEIDHLNGVLFTDRVERNKGKGTPGCE
ncbi:MAG: peptide deformylase [Clostridia bacterium]|nr:peptide deformylase [Clostridia bacterium]